MQSLYQVHLLKSQLGVEVVLQTEVLVTCEALCKVLLETLPERRVLNVTNTIRLILHEVHEAVLAHLRKVDHVLKPFCDCPVLLLITFFDFTLFVVKCITVPRGLLVLLALFLRRFANASHF